jgi:hypothetical protein
MVFLPNPPVEDAAGGEADKSLRLPCEMRSLFLWGYAKKIILGILNICLWLFFSHALILNKNPHLWMDTNLTLKSWRFWAGFFFFLK